MAKQINPTNKLTKQTVRSKQVVVVVLLSFKPQVIPFKPKGQRRQDQAKVHIRLLESSSQPEVRFQRLAKPEFRFVVPFAA